jgi:hypothetical protein
MLTLVMTAAPAVLYTCRAAGYGRLGTAATAPQSVARGSVITSGLWGNNAARFNDDIFGTGTVFVPPSEHLWYAGSNLHVCCQPACGGAAVQRGHAKSGPLAMPPSYFLRKNFTSLLR